jgi:formate dehydrogenase assembly factor FdhD
MKDGTDAVRSYPIDRVGRGGSRADVDRVTIEEPREIRIGGQTLAVTMRTPGHDFELAAGFLVAEGIVWRSSEILRIEHCREVRSAVEEGNVRPRPRLRDDPGRLPTRLRFQRVFGRRSRRVRQRSMMVGRIQARSTPATMRSATAIKNAMPIPRQERAVMGGSLRSQLAEQAR